MRLTFIVLYLFFYVLSWLCFLAILLASSVHVLSFRSSWASFGSYYFFYTNLRNYFLAALFLFSGLLPSVLFFVKGGFFVFSVSSWSWVLLILIFGNFFFTIIFYLYLFRYKNFINSSFVRIASLEFLPYTFLYQVKASGVIKKTKNHYILFFFANFVLLILFSSFFFLVNFFYYFIVFCVFNFWILVVAGVFLGIVISAFFFSFLFWILTFLGKWFYSSHFFSYKLVYYECGFKAVRRLTYQLNINFSLLILFVIIYDGEFFILVPASLNFYFTNFLMLVVFFFFFSWLLIVLYFDYIYSVLEWQP